MSLRATILSGTILVLIMAAGFFVSHVVRAMPPFGLDGVGLGETTYCWGGDCVAETSLTTSSSNDVIIVVAECGYRECSLNITSVSDSTGLAFTQRVTYTPNDRLWEYYAIADSALTSDKITVAFSGEANFVSLVTFAISGADTGMVFDPDPSMPAMTACGDPRYCSILARTSKASFVIASTAIDDAARCSPFFSRFTEIGFDGDLDVNYRISDAGRNNIDFACVDTEPVAIVLDAIVMLELRPHAPILIDGNDAFTADNGVTGGSGTSSDPYVIEGWDINASTANGIEVRNADAYFLITNVYVHSGRLNFPYPSHGYNGTVFINVTNGRLEDSILDGNRDGVSITASDTISMTGNLVQDNAREGVALVASSNVEIADNDVSNNPDVDDIGLGAIIVFDSSNIDVSSNRLVNDAYAAIFFDQASNFSIVGNQVVRDHQVGVCVLSSSGFLISANDVEESPSGNIVVRGSSAFTIQANKLYSHEYNAYSIAVSESAAFEISGNHMTPSARGMSLEYVTDATIDGNTVEPGVERATGATIDHSANVSFSDNNFVILNGDGFVLTSSSNILVNHNDFAIFGGSFEVAAVRIDLSENVDFSANDVIVSLYLGKGKGLDLTSSSNVLIYQNNFVLEVDNYSTGVQAVDNLGTNNSWSNGYPSGGNYWSDYPGVDNCSGPNQDECAVSDGIGDTPYVFNYNQDNYPLMQPVSSTDFMV